MAKYFFMHRVQENAGVISKGIEVHETLDDAVRSFWGRMKTGYGTDAGMTFVSCKITDDTGAVITPYDLTWNAEAYDPLSSNRFFMHHIRLDGETYSKDIDVCATFDAARAAYAAQMEYGYNNPRFPNVKLVSCEITDRSGAVMEPFAETWAKEEAAAEE